MKNKTADNVRDITKAFPITIAGEVHYLRFTAASLLGLEDSYGSIEEGFSALNEATSNPKGKKMSILCEFIHIALLHEEPAVTFNDIKRMEMRELFEAIPVLGKCVNASMPEVDVDAIKAEMEKAGEKNEELAETLEKNVQTE